MTELIILGMISLVIVIEVNMLVFFWKKTVSTLKKIKKGGIIW